MKDFRPPAPVPPKKQPSFIEFMWRMRHDSLAILNERSYGMKMGRVWFPGREVFMVNQPSLVRRILVEKMDAYPKTSLLEPILRPLLGDGVFVSNGDLWKRQRRMINPAFEQARVEDVLPHMLEGVEALRLRLVKIPDGGVLDVEEEMNHVTADVIFRTIFSVPLKSEDAHGVYEAFMDYQRYAPPVAILQAIHFPTFLSLNRFRAVRAAKKIRRLLEGMVKQRQVEIAAGKGGNYKDILASLLNAKDQETGAGFTFRELIDQVALFFLAGHETSAASLSWSLYLMAKCPHIQERLHDEAVRVFPDRDPAFSDMRKLRFARDVFRETLRLYPPIGFMVREATEHEVMRDKNIKPGCPLVLSPWLLHRHRKHWEKPDIFDPDRFSRKETKESLRAAYLPFSMGPRVCSGAAFATQEATLIIAAMSRDYRLEAIEGDDPVPVSRVTIRARDGIRVRLSRR